MNETFQLLPPRDQAKIDAEPYADWTLPNGRRWTEFFRLDGAYLLRFPDLADFAVAMDTLEVSCHPAPGVMRGTVEHLYLNQVLPLVLSARGRQVYHASAVAIEGAAVAFLGESGRGKSTLAAAFAVAGTPFLTDDGLVLEHEAGSFHALPSHPSIRLWADSERALVPAGAERAPEVEYTSKARFLAGAALNFCEQPVPLQRAFFLGDGSAQRLRIEPMRPQAAMLELVQNSFILDYQAHARLGSHFEAAASLANQPIHFRLDYPRRFEDLDAVREAIVRHLAGGSEG